jgi:hypothetical protein
MTGECTKRRAEDIAGQELSYAEVKAIASGNPAVLTLAEADAELQRLGVLKRNHADEQYLARRSVRDLPGTIASLSQRLASLTTDQATAATHAADPITIGNRKVFREEAVEILGASLDALPRHVSETRRFPLGSYRGLRFGLALHLQFAPDVYLEGAATRQEMLSRDHHGPRAVLNALERLAKGYDSECARLRKDLEIAEAQLRDYEARLGKPFPHDAYLFRLAGLRDQLKAGLSGVPPEPGSEPGPTVSELAEQIKALQAEHSIEATPERVGIRRSAAVEEPVTARIRRRSEAIPASDPAPGPESALPPEPAAASPNTDLRNASGPHSARVLAGETDRAELSPALGKTRQRSLF